MDWAVFSTFMPSDWLFLVFALGVAAFTLDYGIFSPWWKHPLGWIMFGYSLSLCVLVFLVLFAMLTGSRIDEWARTIATFFLAVALVGKIVILHVSRREGRIERRRIRPFTGPVHITKREETHDHSDSGSSGDD